MWGRSWHGGLVCLCSVHWGGSGPPTCPRMRAQALPRSCRPASCQAQALPLGPVKDHLCPASLDAPPRPCSCGRGRQTGSAWEGSTPASTLPKVLEGAAPTPPPCFHLEPVSSPKPWKVCLHTTPQMFLFFFLNKGKKRIIPETCAASSVMGSWQWSQTSHLQGIQITWGLALGSFWSSQECQEHPPPPPEPGILLAGM